MLVITAEGSTDVDPVKIDIVSYSIFIAKINKHLSNGHRLYLDGPIAEVGKIKDGMYTSTLSASVYFKEETAGEWEAIQEAHKFNPDYEDVS
jgi:hypothetical protein